MTEIDYIIAIVAAFLGSIGSGLAGWLASGEPFSKRKFAGSAWSAIVAAMLFAAAYQKASDLNAANFIFAFLGGAGIDNLTYAAQKLGREIRQ
jgi:hypothetical protein